MASPPRFDGAGGFGGVSRAAAAIALALMIASSAGVVGVEGESSSADGSSAAAAPTPRPFGPRTGAWVGRRNLALGRKCKSSSLLPGTSVKTLTDGQRFGVFEVGDADCMAKRYTNARMEKGGGGWVWERWFFFFQQRTPSRVHPPPVGPLSLHTSTSHHRATFYPPLGLDEALRASVHGGRERREQSGSAGPLHVTSVR